ncbi:MAG: glycosyltransferase [Nitrospinae bacterium]|nr:glycosyltransferase [Nitrospinota bacterium]
MKSIAIVIPWFGKEIKGGAEQHTWNLAVELVKKGIHVEVFTTCCKAFQEDWNINHYPEGETMQDDILIRRFNVDIRNTYEFHFANKKILSVSRNDFRPEISPVSKTIAEDFIRENIHSTNLINYLVENEKKYDSILFVTYFYGVTIAGMNALPHKAFLLPALHDEWYAYLPQVAEIFRKAKGLLFLSDGEKEVASKLYGPAMLHKGTVVGGGVELHLADDLPVVEEQRLRKKVGNRFTLLLGRRDVNKNTLFIIDVYKEFLNNNPTSTLKIVFAGPGKMPVHDEVNGIVDLGLVSEEEKNWLLKNTLFLSHPSVNESYSRVMMEAWLRERPVIVHRDCLATAIVTRRCQGGWLAAEKDEWVNLFEKLDASEADLLDEAGKKGKQYVDTYARWEKAIEGYCLTLGLFDKEKSFNGEKSFSSSNLVNAAKWDLKPNVELMEALQDGKRNILFVGEIEKENKLEDLLEGFSHYHSMDCLSRLIIAGNVASKETYQSLVTKSNVLNISDSVIFAGNASLEDLHSYFRTAHLFWSMSEKEDFPVSLVDAMWFNVPLLAYKNKTAPVLGEAGIIFTTKKDYKKLAALVFLILSDNQLRSKIVEAQQRRREELLKSGVSV